MSCLWIGTEAGFVRLGWAEVKREVKKCDLAARLQDEIK